MVGILIPRIYRIKIIKIVRVGVEGIGETAAAIVKTLVMTHVVGFSVRFGSSVEVR